MRRPTMTRAEAHALLDAARDDPAAVPDWQIEDALRATGDLPGAGAQAPAGARVWRRAGSWEARKVAALVASSRASWLDGLAS